MILMAIYATTTDLSALANYGLGGLIFFSMVVPLSIYIIKDKDKQISYRDEELARSRAELADLRRVLEPIAPAITDMSRTLSTAITILERSKP